jgi:hypothetical protein
MRVSSILPSKLLEIMGNVRIISFSKMILDSLFNLVWLPNQERFQSSAFFGRSFILLISIRRLRFGHIVVREERGLSAI